VTAALLEPFGYGYMVNAMGVSALVGGVCAFLSAFLMLKGWSLIGDALSHSIVPGVAGAYMLGCPSRWAPSGRRAGGRRHAVPQPAHQAEGGRDHRPDLHRLLRAGLFMVSVSPTSVDIQTIVLGNILAITPGDTLQLVVIAACR
jgi:manganese/iron transport system permease protein